MNNKEWKEFVVEELDNLRKRVLKIKRPEELNNLWCNFTGNGRNVNYYNPANGISQLWLFFDKENKKFGIKEHWTGGSDYGGDNRYTITKEG